MATQADHLLVNGVSVQNAGNTLQIFNTVFYRVFTFVVEHQRRRAEYRVRPFLARQSDVSLLQLGYTAEEIAAIRG